MTFPRDLLTKRVPDLQQPIEAWIDQLRSQLETTPTAQLGNPAAAGVRLYVVDALQGACLHFTVTADEMTGSSTACEVDHVNAGNFAAALESLLAPTARPYDSANIVTKALQFLNQSELYRRVSAAYPSIEGHWLIALLKLREDKPAVLVPAYRIHSAPFMSDAQLLDWISEVLAADGKIYRQLVDVIA